MKNYVVEFACGPDGDHTTPYTECTTSSSKTFTKINQLLDFIGQCSYVYHLDSLLRTVARDKQDSVNIVKESQVIIKEEL